MAAKKQRRNLQIPEQMKSGRKRKRQGPNLQQNWMNQRQERRKARKNLIPKQRKRKAISKTLWRYPVTGDCSDLFHRDETV